jgi:hypothetical protein
LLLLFPGNEEENDLTLAWCRDVTGRNIKLTGPMIQTKAIIIEFAQQLGKTEFKASNGWFDSFKLGNSISYGTISGDREDVNFKTVEDWKSKLKTLLLIFLSVIHCIVCM